MVSDPSRLRRQWESLLAQPQLQERETLTATAVMRLPTWSYVRDRNWRGDPRLAPVSDQYPFMTCIAHSSCRALETVAAIDGAMIRLEANELHQCVAGFDCRFGPPQASQVLLPLRNAGAPRGAPGSFTPGNPCPDPPTARVRPNGVERFNGEADTKAWIANRSPVVAVMSAQNRFLDVDDWSIYRESGAPDFNHAVLLIGFDDEADCWIIQNSFGLAWGDSGFGRIAYGHCGILQDDFHAAFRVF